MKDWVSVLVIKADGTTETGSMPVRDAYPLQPGYVVRWMGDTGPIICDDLYMDGPERIVLLERKPPEPVPSIDSWREVIE